MDRLKEEVDVDVIWPLFDGLEDAFCADDALAVVLWSKRPVVVASAVGLLQVYQWRMRPGVSKPCQVIIAGRPCMQGTGMSHVKAEQDGNTSTNHKAGERERVRDSMTPLPGH